MAYLHNQFIRRKGMNKVKIFSNGRIEQLELDVNKFLKQGHQVLNIKFSTTINNFSVLVHYMEKK